MPRSNPNRPVAANQAPLNSMRTKRPNLLAMLALPSGLLLNQCASTHVPEPETPEVSSVVSAHWVKVSSRPPTYFPRGVSADRPTDCQSGDWVETGDAVGTKYFIPVACPAGEPREILFEEALSARSARNPQQIEDETRGIQRKDVIAQAASIPLTIFGTILCSLGFPPDFLTETQWKEEWNSSKEPHHE